MPSNIVLKNLSEPVIKGEQFPLVDTRSTLRNGFRGAFASSPILRFSDIISGPSSGLGDGLGSGVIVTIWGQGLGNSQANSVVSFTDSLGAKREAAYVYYWKKADGEAPGGPANLWESSSMQEIAFSIPASSANGLGDITVTVSGKESASLPFTVRAGNVYWVATGGDNNASGTFAEPKEFINGNINPGVTPSLGNGNLIAGDFVYSRGVLEPSFTAGGISAGMYLRSIEGTQNSPVSIIAYPGAQSKVSSENRGINPYLSFGVVISKYFLEVGHQLSPIDPISAGDPSASNYHIGCTQYGRAVGNYMQERDGYTFNGWSGAIFSGGESGDSFKMLGNHFFDLGDDTTSHFQHTTYMSVRNNLVTTNAWEASFNYLQDCKAKFGIHFYDESYDGGCGVLNGTLAVKNNVIVNQKGTGINIRTNDASEVDGICWNTDIEIIGNILINCGLGPVAEPNNGTSPYSIALGGDISATTVIVDSNIIWRFSREDSRATQTPIGLSLTFEKVNPNITITNNVFYGDYDAAWLLVSGISTVDVATHNAFFNIAETSVNAVVPGGFTQSVTANPDALELGSRIAILPESPLLEAGNNKQQNIGIYGTPTTNIGAI